jgi:hypothetical protein
LVGWWPFNGNANDESGNGNNGTVNGATLTADRFGNINSSYDFNGVNNNIFVPNSGSLSLNGSVSISLWGKLSAQTTGLIIHLRNNSNSHETSIRSNAPLNYDMGNGISGANVVVQSIVPTDTNWHNLISIYNTSSNQSFFYVDGILQGISNNGITILGNIHLGFGSAIYQSISNQFFKGKIDDIGIWNRALTQQEITDLYNGNICYQNITVTDTLLINMGITGYNPVTYSNIIKIFPNPTNDHLTLNYGNFASLSGYQLKIENSLGQQVFQTNITQQSDYISLTNWGGNGLYFVRIIDPQGNTIDIRKIVLQ